MKLIYVAGPFNGTVEFNIRAAEEIGRRLVEVFSEVQPVVPHSLGRVLFGVQEETRAYEGTLLLMSVCHGVLLTSRWRSSKGAVKEYKEALRMGMPVFEEEYVFSHTNKFRAWLDGSIKFIFHHQQNILDTESVPVRTTGDRSETDLCDITPPSPSWPLPGYHKE